MKTKLFLSILFILIISRSISFGQIKLEGTYCTPGGFVGYSLTFKNDSLFNYSYWSCMNSEELSGTYKLNKKNLTLDFHVKDTLESSFEIKNENCKSNDSIILKFLITDKSINEAIPFANILTNGLAKNKFYTTSNMDGNATLKVNKSNKKFEVNVDYVGYKRMIFKITPNECKEIIVKLASSGSLSSIDYGSKWEYKIRKHKFGKFILQKENTKIILNKKEQ